MREDPAKSVDSVTVHYPPSSGPGSGKDAWVRFARRIGESNGALWQTIRDQSAIIDSLQRENEGLRKRISERKPKGGRPSLPDHLVTLIRDDLARGYSQRATAVRNGVSAMTVSRLARA